jgi:phage protein D
MLTPAYKLTIGDRVVDTTAEPQTSTIVKLVVALDMETPADCFTLVLGQVGSFKPQREDETTIELGYADNGGLTQVIAGTVVTVEPNLTTVRVQGYSAATAVLATLADQTYESKTAGAIVRDLAERAGVEVAAAQDGITFPAYVIDGRRSLYQHMQDLAELCGFDLYINAEGKLVFEKFAGGRIVHVLEFAKHILALDVLRAPPLAGLVETWGESPTGTQGDDAWSWLTKDFSGSKGSAGSGSRLLLERSALRTSAAARTAASAALTTIRRRTLRGVVRALGRAEVKLGDAIQLRGLSDEALNKHFQVRSVTHTITKVGGFTTTIGFRAID